MYSLCNYELTYFSILKTKRKTSTTDIFIYIVDDEPVFRTGKMMRYKKKNLFYIYKQT